MLVPIEMLVKVYDLYILYLTFVHLQAEAAPRAEATTTDRSDTEKNAFKFFQDVAGADLEVDALELQKIMNHVFKKGM